MPRPQPFTVRTDADFECLFDAMHIRLDSLEALAELGFDLEDESNRTWLAVLTMQDEIRDLLWQIGELWKQWVDEDVDCKS